MAEQVKARKLSPVELVEAHLRSIERLNPKLNAFIAVDAERALASARAAEQAVHRGDRLGVLHGVPMSIKSSISVAGMPFETGSRLRGDMRGQEDATLVARLKSEGAIILGVTNVPEMLMAYFTDNAIYGCTNSPFDLGRTPGGSSGGEAAAIGSQMSAAGIGSDGGGSVRVPAHFCGIFGLKPTPGRISIAGHYPESGGPFASLGVVGPMARSVRDLNLLFHSTAGFDLRDPLSAPVATKAPAWQEVKKLRVGYFEDDGDVPVTPETSAAVRAAADALERDGFDVRPFRPGKIAEARANWWVFFVLCGAAILEPEFPHGDALMSDTMSESTMSEGLREFIAISKAGEQLSRELLLRAWFERDAIRLDILREMEESPILLSPVCSIPAFRHGEREWQINGKSVDYLSTMSYSQWVNAVGFPAASVPVGRSPEGLPIGVQIIGRPYDDENVLEVAAALERSFPWSAPDMKWAAAR